MGKTGYCLIDQSLQTSTKKKGGVVLKEMGKETGKGKKLLGRRPKEKARKTGLGENLGEVMVDRKKGAGIPVPLSPIG